MTRNSLFSITLILGAIFTATACAVGPTTEPTSTSTQQTAQIDTTTSGDTTPAPAVTTIAAPTAPARSVIIFGATVVSADDGGIQTNAATVTDSGTTTDPESVSEADCLVNLTGVYTFTYTPVGGAPAKTADVGLTVYGGQRSDIYPHNQKAVVTEADCTLEQDYTTSDGNVIVSVLQGNRNSTSTPTAGSGQNEDVIGTYSSNGSKWTFTAHRTGLIAGQ